MVQERAHDGSVPPLCGDVECRCPLLRTRSTPSRDSHGPLWHRTAPPAPGSSLGGKQCRAGARRAHVPVPVSARRAHVPVPVSRSARAQQALHFGCIARFCCVVQPIPHLVGAHARRGHDSKCAAGRGGARAAGLVRALPKCCSVSPPCERARPPAGEGRIGLARVRLLAWGTPAAAAVAAWRSGIRLGLVVGSLWLSHSCNAGWAMMNRTGQPKHESVGHALATAPARWLAVCRSRPRRIRRGRCDRRNKAAPARSAVHPYRGAPQRGDGEGGSNIAGTKQGSQ